MAMAQTLRSTFGSKDRSTRRDPRTVPLWMGIFLIFAIFGSFLVWAALTWLDRGVTTSGRVQIETERLTISTLIGGRVNEVFVKENEFVTAGTVLLTLETEEEKERLNLLRYQLLSNQLEQARHQAMISDLDQIDVSRWATERASSPELAALIDGQIALFKSDRQSLEQQLEILESRKQQTEEGIEGLRARRTAVGTQLSLVSEELDGMRYLSEKGYVPKTRVLALARAEAGLVGERAQLLSEITLRQNQMGEIDKSILQLKTEAVRNASTRLDALKRQESELKYNIAVAEQDQDNKVIVSPHDGIVLGLSVFHSDHIVGAGKPLMYIVPEDEQLIIGAKIGSGDIEGIYQDMPVEVRVKTSSGLKAARRSPLLLGHVEEVSPDVLNDPQSGLDYYEVKVAIEPGEWKKLEGVRVIPGMGADLLFKAGRRSVLDFLVSPLSFIFERGMAVP
ncbi:HlyD family type I secretion periplasmic adaptor subunit [Thalassobaculum sp. OXR-137]|uniref:HlyD family type I secretion periplasmic adaptor subunit n=1 Tax=Thalassobaculum sp. OXR-137 TaxID=3100173 RepID=UPI002AC93D18|nr:HlyD family type I secretion periplasmic adaptor subunit [Thalassobaculum sp. OXR-137]WPZ36184.1 HlyD family type I secretion periplasmic adaptor subunit [Thalassobaculum sp. OXR-137]